MNGVLHTEDLLVMTHNSFHTLDYSRWIFTRRAGSSRLSYLMLARSILGSCLGKGRSLARNVDNEIDPLLVTPMVLFLTRHIYMLDSAPL